MDPNNAEDNSFESMDANQALYPGRNGDDDEQGFDMKALKVKSEFEYPISLDTTAEIQNILAAGVFKNLESPILYEKLCNMMLSQRYLNLVEGLFWTIFVVKYQKNDVELLERFRRQLGRLYSEYFSLLQQPKEELSNLGIFGGAYIAHVMFFNIFLKEREQFDMRFILDCYHIVIHEVNGVFVSDFYIQTSIEKIFGNKFFHYEKLAQKKKKVEKKDFRNEPLLRDLQFNLDDLPQVPGGLDLAYELSAKLRRAPKKYKNGTLNELNESKSTHSVTKPTQPILKLTQPEEKSMISSSSEANRPYFPKLKFNCHQISPTVSGFLDNSTHTLPFQKKKVINYSNNKNVTEGVHMSLPTFETEPDTKTEKKDKNKAQQKWTTGDYKLNNRNEDYYLGYMPKDIKKKFKVELDMKYIFDNIKPVLRGSYSLKPLSDGYFNKYQQPSYSYGNTPQEAIKIIKEEQEEDPRDAVDELGLERQETEMNKADVSMKERREDVTGIEDLNISKNFRTVEDEGGLPLIRSKTKSNRDESFNVNRRGSLKKSNLLPKIHDEINMTVDAAELKKTFTSPSLKYSTAANKKLGKGRFFVSLKDYKEEDPDQEDPQVKYGKYKYSNKRLHYIEEHDRAIRKDVDANIENLIDRLMSKKTSFKQSFKGKM